MRERVIRYKGKDIIVTFIYNRCNHYSACLEEAPNVFDVSATPWVRPDLEPAERIAEVIEKCPTGALHYIRQDGGDDEKIPAENTVTVAEDGPFYIHGEIEIQDENSEIFFQDTRIALCRCGLSEIQPLCDGRHLVHNSWAEGTFASDQPWHDKSDLAPGKLLITLVTDGPYLLNGPVIIKDTKGVTHFQGIKAALCRCGKSKEKPFCDGNHSK